MDDAVIDWVIRVGGIVTSLTAIGAVLGYYYRLKGDVRVMRHDMNNMQTTMGMMSDTLKLVNETLSKVAVQDNRLLHLEEDIREMRLGHGFIVKKPPLRGS